MQQINKKRILLWKIHGDSLKNNLIFKYRKNKKPINQTTKKNLDKFLLNYFGKSNFSFFDVGGENIDLYLHLLNKLNIDKYYIYNFKSLIILFRKLKSFLD